MFATRVQGRTGSIRISRRGDLDHTSFGFCTVDELPGSIPPKAGDVLLLAKRHMADPSPYKVTVLLTEERANALRSGFTMPPPGITERRSIGDRVRKNLESVAPRCHAQGIITSEALAYLMAWSNGDWPRKARPSAYPYLLHRCEVPFAQPACASGWCVPRRLKHVDLCFDASDGAVNDDEDFNEDQVGAIELDG